MATAALSARSLLTGTRRNLDRLGSKVKTAVTAKTGYGVEHVLTSLGTVDYGSIAIAEAIILEVYVLAGDDRSLPHPDDVLAAVKRATGCRDVREMGYTDERNPRGMTLRFKCSITASGSTRLPEVTQG